jgi:hypothetical protein
METNPEEKFIGRHEQFCLVKKFLGEEVPDLEVQIARNKDASERSDILNRLEEIEGFVKSKDFTQDTDVLKAYDEIMKLISDAGKICISKNDHDLGNRLYKVLDDIVGYVKAKYKKQGEFTDELNQKLDSISKNFRLADFLTYLQLHDLLQTSDQQMGFYVWNSLVKRNGFIITLLQFNKGMKKDGSTDANREFAESYPKRLTGFAEGLLQAGRISSEDLEKVREEISRGEQ